MRTRFVLSFPTTERENVDGQEEADSRGPPARTAAQKKSPARKTSPRKTAAKSTARRKLKTQGAGAAAPRKARAPEAAHRHQPLSREDFKADGLRAYAQYRDLGIADASHGLAQAHVIRLIGPCNPAEVSKLHFHDVDFQMVYVLKGWVKTYMEGQGETLMQAGQLPGPSRRGSST